MTRKTDQITFRASDLAGQLDARTDGRLSAGLVAKRDLERYYETLRRSLPTFGSQEALAILDTCNGTLWEPHTVRLIWANVEDAIRLEALDQKWNIDGAALVARLRSLSYAEALAVVDAAERYWCSAEEDADAALAATGLVAAEEVPL